jgi:hypothetical protein
MYIFSSRRIDISAMNDSMMKSFQVEVPPGCPQRERVAWVVPWPSDRPFRRWCAPLQSLVRAAAIAGARVALLVGGWRLSG